jgi:integrase
MKRSLIFSMEPEKFLTLTEFNALLKAAKDDRERCILLLLAGAGLRVGEMTQIRAEDVEISAKGTCTSKLSMPSSISLAL